MTYGCGCYWAIRFSIPYSLKGKPARYAARIPLTIKFNLHVFRVDWTVETSSFEWFIFHVNIISFYESLELMPPLPSPNYPPLRPTLFQPKTPQPPTSRCRARPQQPISNLLHIQRRTAQYNIQVRLIDTPRVILPERLVIIPPLIREGLL
jgi:hypothetical protein